MGLEGARVKRAGSERCRDSGNIFTTELPPSLSLSFRIIFSVLKPPVLLCLFVCIFRDPMHLPHRGLFACYVENLRERICGSLGLV